MSANDIRSRDGLPFNFEDGLKVRGNLLRGVKGAAEIGYTLKDLELRNRYGINVIAIKRDNGIEISPNGNNILLSGDVLLVIGSVKDIRKLENARAD